MKKRAAMIMCATMLVFAMSACSSSEETKEEPEESNVEVEDVTIEETDSDSDKDSDKDTNKGTDSDSGTKSGNGEDGTKSEPSSSEEKTIEGEITMCDGAQMYVKTDDGEEYKFLIASAKVSGGNEGLVEGTKVTVTYSGEKDSDGLYEAKTVEQHE